MRFSSHNELLMYGRPAPMALAFRQPYVDVSNLLGQLWWIKFSLPLSLSLWLLSCYGFRICRLSGVHFSAWNLEPAEILGHVPPVIPSTDY